MLLTCSTHIFLTAKQNHSEEIVNQICIWIKGLKIFVITGLHRTPHSFRFGSVSLSGRFKHLMARVHAQEREGGHHPMTNVATPAWLLRSFLLRYATVFLARIRKSHLAPWDQKVYSLKFKLCLKLSQWENKSKKGYLLTYLHASFHVDLFFAQLTVNLVFP